ncbi:MAG: MFS transporter [Pseudonocardia sp.]|nr:MFS transporter [Pseudonocardia sp.]
MSSVLAIPAFRRLWTVTAITSTGEWLSVLAMTSLATHLAAGAGYTAQSFALGGTVAAKLLPSLLFGPLAGALADRFDRRKLMATCDTLKFVLLFSIPIVGSLWWLLAATFLIELCAMFWIPAKDAAVPNLLRRPDQMETAAQLGLVVTYGVAVAGGAGLFALVTKFAPLVDATTPTTAVYLALFVNSFAFLFSALMVWFRIPELSGRPAAVDRAAKPPSLVFMLRDGFSFVATTPLVRGLVIGIIGAFTAGGAVIATAKLYSSSLGGGDAAYSMLFVAVFGGLALGMAVGPRLAQRLPHNRLFGTAIVGAGLSLVVVAVAVHLFMAIVAVMFVGGFAGVAFLTGLTIIGTQVADEVRGRVNAFVQSLVRVVLLGAMSLVPIVVGVVATRTITIDGTPYLIDGTRFVLGGAGIVAAVVGTLAYRQMDDRRLEPLLTDLVAALRHGERRTGSGVLIAIEGATPAETSRQAGRLAASLRERGHRVIEPDDEGDEARWSAATREADLGGARAKALAAAAVRADLVERVIRPALDSGTVVVMDRFMASPLAQFGVAAEQMGAAPDDGELETLGKWASGRLRPDMSVLLDRAPDATGGAAAPVAGAEHARVQKLLARMVAVEPHRHVVIDADGTEDDVAERVRDGVFPLIPAPGTPAAAAETVPTSTTGTGPIPAVTDDAPPPARS